MTTALVQGSGQDYVIAHFGSTCFAYVSTSAPRVNNQTTGYTLTFNFGSTGYTEVCLRVPRFFSSFELGGITAQLNSAGLFKNVNSVDSEGYYTLSWPVLVSATSATLMFLIPKLVTFEHYSKQGISKVWNASSGNVGSTWNDRISSVVISPYTRLTLFQHEYWAGASKVCAVSSSEQTLDLPDFNDTTTSFRLEAIH